MGASENFTKSRVGKLGCLPSAEVQLQITAKSDKLDLSSPILLHPLPQPDKAQEWSEKVAKADSLNKLSSLKQIWAGRGEKLWTSLGLESWY